MDEIKNLAFETFIKLSEQAFTTNIYQRLLDLQNQRIRNLFIEFKALVKEAQRLKTHATPNEILHYELRVQDFAHAIKDLAKEPLLAMTRIMRIGVYELVKARMITA